MVHHYLLHPSTLAQAKGKLSRLISHIRVHEKLIFSFRKSCFDRVKNARNVRSGFKFEFVHTHLVDFKLPNQWASELSSIRGNTPKCREPRKYEISWKC
jgi:hypothetical protein